MTSLAIAQKALPIPSTLAPGPILRNWAPAVPTPVPALTFKEKADMITHMSEKIWILPAILSDNGESANFIT